MNRDVSDATVGPGATDAVLPANADVADADDAGSASDAGDVSDAGDAATLADAAKREAFAVNPETRADLAAGICAQPPAAADARAAAAPESPPASSSSRARSHVLSHRLNTNAATQVRRAPAAGLR